jgi:glycosyltransferase involved in cell wall biosynthesis
MNILRVASDLYPVVVGGIGIHVHELSKWQVKYGHHVTVFTNGRKKFKKQELIDGYQVRRFPVRFNFFGNSISPDLIPALIQYKGQFDIIHAHSHLFFSTNVCTLNRLLDSTPLIVTNHGLISASAPEWLNQIYKKTITKITFDIADCILCYTEIEKKNIEKLGINTKKIRVIHNGVDTTLFTPHPNKKKNGFQHLLWVGRFVLGKRVDLLIEAYNTTLKEYPNARLTLVGEGPLKESIENKIEKLGLKKNIQIINRIDNSDLPALYNQADIFILPSLMEGIPRTLLEAMSCGIPVIVTELPHLANLVKDAGLFIPRENPIVLSEQIARLLQNKELALRLGNHGREIIEKQYSWQDTVQQTLNVYQEFV